MSNPCVINKLSSPHKISLYKNGDNPYIYYYFRWKKKKFQGTTGVTVDNIKLATDKAIEIFFDFTKGIREKGRQKNIRFEEIIKKFLDFKKQQKKSARTLSDYQRQSKYLIEKFKDRNLESLCSKATYLEYSEWRRKYYQTHEKKRQIIYKRNGKVLKGRLLDHVGDVPINRECRLLVNILRFAKEYLDLLKNVEIPSYKIIPENRRDALLSRDEYIKLKEYWMQKNPYYFYIISFLNNTGIRYPSELNRICWADVNLEKSYVLIRNRKSKNKVIPLNTPVPLVGRSKEIIEILKARKNISTNPNDPVFVNDNGKQIKNIYRAFKNSLEKCKIKNNITLYSMRHLFATRMIRRPDIPIKILSDVLGHRDTTMIEQHYSHLRAEHYVDVFQRSEDHKQEILKNRNNNTTPEQTATDLPSSSQSSNQ